MPASRFWFLRFFRPAAAIIAVFAVSLVAAASAAEPLHPRIDRLINAAPLGPVAPICTDAEFIRLVSLDLTGMIPSGLDTKAFLDDPAPDKRAKLIDKLLANPHFSPRG